MGRYIGPVCRLCRRERVKLYLKGDKCFSDKCPLSRRRTLPGMHGRVRRKLSEYGIRFREKQKLKRLYQVSERQFSRFFEMAGEIKGGEIGQNFVVLLERRLDNVVYRLGFAPSRRTARQLVAHKHILVNGRPVNIPSYLVEPGDTIEIRKEKMKEAIKKRILEKQSFLRIPDWLSLDKETLKAKVERIPEFSPNMLDAPVELMYVVEFYSR